MINLPSRLFATRAEFEQAKSGNDPELARKYIEALEEIAYASLEIDRIDQVCEDEDDLIEPLAVLHESLGKVFTI